jgi:GNAT superfamily N-acetyltransferase
MMFSDLALARRLERAEGFACVQFAEARRRAFPESGSEWRDVGGTWAAFDGFDGPTTQSFGLGLFGETEAAGLDELERFFFNHGTAAVHEVSPFAGTATLDLLCARGYRPIEISSVLYRAVEEPAAAMGAGVSVRVIGTDEADLWSSISARGWTAEHPELEAMVREFGGLCAARDGSPCFLAELDGVPGAAGAMSMYEGVALFGGASTIPEMRRRGLQAALLEERMRHAAKAGCDVAMMVTEAGSNSQRNAERKGFRIAYTRMKWRLERK